MLRMIVCSKDRASQLDLLLRSVKKQFHDWGQQTIIVLQRTTTDSFAEGYRLLAKEHPEVIYVEEESFRSDFQKLALDGEESHLQLLVDDNVFVRPFSLDDREFRDFSTDDLVAALSLRMNPSMDYCYTENVYTGTPWFRADRAWYWPGLRGDWGYPNSVDGNIWRRADVRAVIGTGAYERLHQLEPALRLAMRRPLSICYGQSRILNVANNTVQDCAVANRHGGGDATEMNERYLAGEHIGLENIEQAAPKSPHFEIEYQWAG